jgi:hypothetical protein
MLELRKSADRGRAHHGWVRRAIHSRLQTILTPGIATLGRFL